MRLDSRHAGWFNISSFLSITVLVTEDEPEILTWLTPSRVEGRVIEELPNGTWRANWQTATG